jgi:hypothetical protein
MLKRLIRCGVMASTALLALAGPASAGIWTPVTSGTTSDITAVKYVAPGTLVYGTAGGALLKNGVVKNNANPGLSVNDIAFNPSGTVGVAVLNGGRLMRTTNAGDSWTAISLANSTRSQASPCSGGATVAGTPTGNLTGVSWGDDRTAYVVGDDKGMVLKSVDGGSTFSDTSRLINGTCRVGRGDLALNDVEAVSANVVYFVTPYFGARYISTDGIASPATYQDPSGANCSVERTHIGVDHDSPNRIWVVDGCTGNLSWGYSGDTGATFDISIDIPNGDPYALSGFNGVDVAGGSALAVGNSGTILVNPEGPTAYLQKADGADATTGWLAVSKLDAGNAVVGGRGGRLITTTQANAIPDLVAPAATISGPTNATAGQAVTYTANATDNAGGSGIDPASFVWSSPGLPNATGNPATLTFPSAGIYNVTVAFKDLAGNAASAQTAVYVTVPGRTTLPPAPGPGTPTRPVSPTRTTTATTSGATIALGTPNRCVAPGSTFRVTLTWRKQKRKGNRFVKVRRADFYIGTRRVKIDTRAPFTQTLKVTASTRRGSTITVKARAYIKVSRGRSPTKSIRTTLRVCT